MDSKLESSSKCKAQVLNAQYTSVFREEDISNIPDLGHNPYLSMSKISVTVNGVKNLLLKLNPKKALGPDIVPTRVLRDYADEIAPILQTIFQQSLDTGDVPDVAAAADGSQDLTRRLTWGALSAKLNETTNLMPHISRTKRIDNMNFSTRIQKNILSQHAKSWYSRENIVLLGVVLTCHLGTCIPAKKRMPN